MLLLGNVINVQPQNYQKKNVPVAGKLLFTTTTKNGSSPPRVSVYSAVLAEAKPDEVGVPSTALLHTFTLAEQDRILMVAPVQPNPVQQPQEQPEPKPETAKKPFKLLVIIDKSLSTLLYSSSGMRHYRRKWCRDENQPCQT